MTRRESAVLSAYTGLLLGPFSALQEYAEMLVGGSVFTHQFADEGFANRLKELAEPDFKKLMQSIPNT